MTVKWTKKDVIAAFEQAMAGQTTQTTQPGQSLMEKLTAAKGKVTPTPIGA